MCKSIDQLSRGKLPIVKEQRTKNYSHIKDVPETAKFTYTR